jgi:beta-propeller uncharacterized protein DUF5122
MKSPRVSIALALLSAAIGLGHEALAWEVSINGRPASDLDSGAAVAIDPVTASIFVTGNRQITSIASGFFVAKYESHGKRQWVQALDGVQGLAVAIDGDGFVIAAGAGSSPTTQADVVLVKMDGRGARARVLWTRTFDIGQSNDVLSGMVLTPDGGIVIVGTANDLQTMFLMKFTSDGQDAWPAPRLIAGSMPGGFNLGTAVAILPDGDIAATGLVSNNITHGDIFAGRFDSASGSPRWQIAINGSPGNGNDLGSAIAVAPNGDIVIGGRGSSSNGPSTTFALLRLTSAGSIRWIRSIEGGFSNSARTVGIAPNGDVIAGGTLETTSGPNNSTFFVLATDPNGNERWRYAATGASFFLEARRIAFDSNGNPIVTGVIGKPDAITAFALVAFDKISGGVLWNLPIVGSLPLVSAGADVVALQGTDAVIAVGTTQNERTSSDITVARVTDGHEEWRALITGPGKRIDRDDNALAIAVHPRQDAIALGGYSEKTCCTVEGSAHEFRVVKVRNNGKVAWKFDFPDPAPHQDNSARAVAFGSGGEVYAAGRTCAWLGASCFTVVKLSKQGREVWHTTIPGTVSHVGEARALAVDDDDQAVLVAGIADGLLAVFKMDGNTGALLWSYSSQALGSANAVALTNRGTVAIAAELGGRFAVVELEKATGAVKASTDLGSGSAQSIRYDNVRDQLVVAGLGTPLVGGDVSGPHAFLRAAKLNADGTSAWTFESPTTAVFKAAVAVSGLDGDVGLVWTGWDTRFRKPLFAAAVLDADGQQVFSSIAPGQAGGVDFSGTTMIAVGQLDGPLEQQSGPFESTFAVLAFADDGAELWRRTAQGDGIGTNSASSVVVDDVRGTIFAAGVVTNTATAADMFAVGLSSGGGELQGGQPSSPE